MLSLLETHSTHYFLKALRNPVINLLSQGFSNLCDLRTFCLLKQNKTKQNNYHISHLIDYAWGNTVKIHRFSERGNEVVYISTENKMRQNGKTA